MLRTWPVRLPAIEFTLRQSDPSRCPPLPNLSLPPSPPLRADLAGDPGHFGVQSR